eukprot:219336_1
MLLWFGVEIVIRRDGICSFQFDSACILSRTNTQLDNNQMDSSSERSPSSKVSDRSYASVVSGKPDVNKSEIPREQSKNRKPAGAVKPKALGAVNPKRSGAIKRKGPGAVNTEGSDAIKAKNSGGSQKKRSRKAIRKSAKYNEQSTNKRKRSGAVKPNGPNAVKVVNSS